MPPPITDIDMDEDPRPANADNSAAEKKTSPPPCPPRPQKPKSPHRDWYCVALPKPQLVTDDEGEQLWQFWYYLHKTTHVKRWLPPIASSVDDISDDEGGAPTIDLTQPKSKSNEISSFFAKVPTEDSFAKELRGEDVVEEKKDTCTVKKDGGTEGEDVEGKEMTPHEKVLSEVWDDEFPVHLYVKKGMEPSLITKAKAIGCYEYRDTRPIIKDKVMEYWIKKCGGADEYWSSPVMVAKRAQLHNTRKLSSNAKRLNEFAEKARAKRDIVTDVEEIDSDTDEEPPEKKAKRERKKIMKKEVSQKHSYSVSIFHPKNSTHHITCTCRLHLQSSSAVASMRMNTTKVYVVDAATNH